MFVQNVLIRGGSALAALSVLVACSTSATRPGEMPERPYQKRVYVGVSGAATRLQPLTGGSAYDLSQSESAGAVATIGMDVGRRTAVEFTAADLGSASLAPIPTAGPAIVAQELAYNSVAGSVVYYGLGLRRQVEQRRGLAGFGRLGVNQTSSSADISLDAEDEFKMFAGLGAEYMFSRSAAVRAEYIGYDGDVTAAQLGLVYRFGSPASAPPKPIQGPLVENRDEQEEQKTPATIVAQADTAPIATPTPADAPLTELKNDSVATRRADESESSQPDQSVTETTLATTRDLSSPAEELPQSTQTLESTTAQESHAETPVADAVASAGTIREPALANPPSSDKTASQTARVTDSNRTDRPDNTRTETAMVTPPVIRQPTTDTTSRPAPPENTQSAESETPEPSVVAKADTPVAPQPGFNGVVRGIDFQPGSAVLTPTANRVVQQLARMLNQSPATRVEIRTHTDAAMDPALAMQLTRQRAVAVARVLIKAGVAKQRLAARAFGSNATRADSATPGGRQLNNRVELKQL